jgi:hypothetical protein
MLVGVAESFSTPKVATFVQPPFDAVSEVKVVEKATFGKVVVYLNGVVFSFFILVNFELCFVGVVKSFLAGKDVAPAKPRSNTSPEPLVFEKKTASGNIFMYYQSNVYLLTFTIHR